MSKPNLGPTTVGIGIGGGTTFGITSDNQIVIEGGTVRYSLGDAHPKQFERIISAFKELSTFSQMEDPK